MLDLLFQFHEPNAIFLAYSQRNAVVIDTHHSMLLGSGRQCYIHGIPGKMLSVLESIDKWYSDASAVPEVCLVERTLHSLCTDYLYGLLIQINSHLF